MAILAFRNLASNTMCAPGHHKGKVAECWMSNKWTSKLPWLFQSSQEGSTATGSTKQVTEHNKYENWSAPPALVHSPSPRCFSLRLSTNSAHQLQVPWETSGLLQLGVFKIPRYSTSLSPHWGFPVAINCYRGSPIAAAHTDWEEGEKVVVDLYL